MAITTVDEYREMMTLCESVRALIRVPFDDDLMLGDGPDFADVRKGLQTHCSKTIEALSGMLHWFRSHGLDGVAGLCERFSELCSQMVADEGLVNENFLLSEPYYCFVALRQELADSQVGVLRSLVGIS